MDTHGPPEEGTPGAPNRVLVVDDEPDLAELYEMWLSEFYTTQTAYDGQSALAVIDDDFDAIVLDRWLPDESGDDVLKEIRKLGLDVPVVMVTAVDPDFDLLDLDIDGYLTKPIERVALLTMLAAAIDRRDDTLRRELSSLIAKQGFLKERKAPKEIEGHEGFDELEARIDELLASVDNPDIEPHPNEKPRRESTSP